MATIRAVGTLLLVAAWGVMPAHAVFDFTEVQDEAGIRFDYIRDAFPAFGAGGTWLDYDDDGWSDLYLTQMVGANRLFRNEGDGTFSAVPAAAGAANPRGYSYGAVAADYDNDGDADLFVTNNGQNRLYQNVLADTGTPGFVDVTEAAGMGDDGSVYSTSAAWGDYDGDGFLDLYVASYAMEFRPEGYPELATPNYLWHNRGDGTFVNVGALTGADRGAPNTRDGLFLQPGATLATTWSDFDNDNDLDIIIINDFGMTVHPSQLLRNDGPDGEGGWTFTDISQASGFDVRILGMGIAVGDIDNDGDLDYYASNGGNNVLLLNRWESGLERFDEIADSAGVLANDPAQYGPMMGPISWGVDFADFDNDGFVDLLVVNGFLDIAAQATSALQPSFIYRNDGDLTFTELHETAGLTEEGLAGKSSGFADYDRDGDVDFFIGSIFDWNPDTESAEPSWYRLYRNDTPRYRHWLSVELTGTLSNRDSVGAKVYLDADGMTQMREVGTGRSFLASAELAQHFGLGGARTIDELRIVWPSGSRFETREVSVDQRWSFTEPTTGLESRLDRTSFRRGEAARIHFTLRNLLDRPRTGDVWLDRIEPDGSVTTLRSQTGVVLGPSAEITGTLNLEIGPSYPLGPTTLVLRWGELGGDAEQQRYEDAFVVE